MPLATLSIDLVAKLANLEAGFTKAQQLAEKNANAIRSAFKQTSDAAAEIGKQLATAFSVTALEEFVRSAIDAQDHLNDLAKRTQTTVEEIGGIGFAAAQAGSDLDGAAVAMQKFNLTIAKAGAGEKAAVEVFDKLGISVKDAEGHLRTSSDLLPEVADKWASFSEGPNKAAIANALFSKGYASMIPLLEDGGDELKRNLQFYKDFSGVTGESAKKADEFNDQVGKIKLQMQGMRNLIVNELVDPLLAIAEAFTKVKSEGEDVPAVVSGVRIAFETLAVVAANFQFVVGAIGRDLAAVLVALQEFAHGNVKGAREVLIQMRVDDAQARADLDAFERRVLRLDALSKDALAGFAKTAASFGGGHPLQEAPPLTSGVTAKHTHEDIDQIEKLIAKLNDQVFAEEHLKDTQQELLKVQHQFATDPAFRNATIEQRVMAEALAEVLDSLKRKFDETAAAAAEHDKLLGEGLAQIAKNEKTINDTFDRIRAATPTEQLKAFNEQIAEIQRRLDNGLISPEVAAEMLNVKLGLFPHDFAAEWKRALDDVQGAFEDTFSGNLVTLFHGTTRGILDSWANLLEQMVAKALAAKIGEALFSSVDAGSIFGAIIKFLGGASSTAGFAENPTPTAGGGMVEAGSIHTVNEQGLEAMRRSGQDILITGSRAGRVVPNSMLQGGGGAVINFQIAAGVSRNELVALIPALTEHVKASVEASMRRPGFRA